MEGSEGVEVEPSCRRGWGRLEGVGGCRRVTRKDGESIESMRAEKEEGEAVQKQRRAFRCFRSEQDKKSLRNLPLSASQGQRRRTQRPNSLSRARPSIGERKRMDRPSSSFLSAFLLRFLALRLSSSRHDLLSYESNT